MSGFFNRLVTDPSVTRTPSRQENAAEKIAAIKRHVETLLNARAAHKAALNWACMTSTGMPQAVATC